MKHFWLKYLIVLVAFAAAISELELSDYIPMGLFRAAGAVPYAIWGLCATVCVVAPLYLAQKRIKTFYDRSGGLWTALYVVLIAEYLVSTLSNAKPDNSIFKTFGVLLEVTGLVLMAVIGYRLSHTFAPGKIRTLGNVMTYVPGACLIIVFLAHVVLESAGNLSYSTSRDYGYYSIYRQGPSDLGIILLLLALMAVAANTISIAYTALAVIDEPKPDDEDDEDAPDPMAEFERQFDTSVDNKPSARETIDKLRTNAAPVLSSLKDSGTKVLSRTAPALSSIKDSGTKVLASTARVSRKVWIAIGAVALVVVVAMVCLYIFRNKEFENMTEGIDIPTITPAEMLGNGGISLVGYGAFSDPDISNEVMFGRMYIEPYRDMDEYDIDEELGVPVQITATSMNPTSNETPDFFIGYINPKTDRFIVFHPEIVNRNDFDARDRMRELTPLVFEDRYRIAYGLNRFAHPDNSYEVYFDTKIKNMADFQATLYDRSGDEMGVFQFYSADVFQELEYRNTRQYASADFDVFGSESDDPAENEKIAQSVRMLYMQLFPAPKGSKNVKAIVVGQITGAGWQQEYFRTAVRSDNKFHIPYTYGPTGELIEQGCDPKLTNDRITVGDVELLRTDPEY